MLSDHQLLKKGFAFIAAGYVTIFCNMVVNFGCRRNKLVSACHFVTPWCLSVDKTLTNLTFM
jgi:hypothetical protein